MEDWKESIQRDLRPFSDPGTRILCTDSENRLYAEWTSRQKPRSATFEQTPDENIKVLFDGSELNYRAFLVSSEMSDLLGLAGMMLQQPLPPFFVETKAARPDQPGEAKPALEVLRDSLSGPFDPLTTVVFVTGDAGAGKTEALRQLVHRQADQYTRGEVDCLYLYVNAQGRALARLDEALATELQDLRANLTYHAVPALVRNGALVPIIDGFDELLGVLGYEDAFSSLRRFVDDLDGLGYLIASARSTYYQQEFLSRTGRVDLAGQMLRVVPIDILPWDDVEFNEYLTFRYTSTPLPSLSKPDFVEKMRDAFSPLQNRSLRTKPFFVAKTADLVLEGVEFKEVGLLEQLVEGYFERERTEKLLDKAGQPLLKSEQIRKIVQLVCDEMWFQETRTIDVATVRTIVELVCSDEALPDEPLKVARERAATMAFFAAAPGRDRIEFEHQLFFSYFLANTILDNLLKDSTALYSVLTRSALPEGAADLAANRLYVRLLSLASVVCQCGDACKLSQTRSSQIRENAGALVASLLRVIAENAVPPHASGVQFYEFVFAGQSFSNVELVDCSFVSIEFRRADLSMARFLRCIAKDVVLHEVLVDPHFTRLELLDFDPSYGAHGLRVRTPSGIEQIFRQDRITSTLVSVGLPLPQPAAPTPTIDPEVIELLEALMLKFERSNMIWPTDVQHRQMTSNLKWPELENLLVDSRVVALETRRDVKGRHRNALRRNFMPFLIMAGYNPGVPVPSNISLFWKAARQNFPVRATTDT